MAAKTYRDAYLAVVDARRGLPVLYGIRLHNVSVLVRQWPSGTPGQGTHNDTLTSLKLNLGTGPIKVRNISTKDIVSSGGLYSAEDIIVGPITPPYSGSGLDNDAITVFDPIPQAGIASEVLFLVTGPGFNPTGNWPGAWFKKIETRTDKPFRYEIVLRKTAECP